MGAVLTRGGREQGRGGAPAQPEFPAQWGRGQSSPGPSDTAAWGCGAGDAARGRSLSRRCPRDGECMWAQAGPWHRWASAGSRVRGAAHVHCAGPACRFRRPGPVHQAGRELVQPHRVRSHGGTSQQQRLEEEHPLRRQAAAVPHSGVRAALPCLSTGLPSLQEYLPRRGPWVLCPQTLGPRAGHPPPPDGGGPGAHEATRELQLRRLCPPRA